MPNPEKPDRQTSTLVAFLKRFGPGLITGASDDDPSGIATFSVAGARFGFATLWVALVTFPMLCAVQFMCAKIGMTSGRGLAGVLRLYYPRPLLYLAVAGLFISNTINVGADIGAIAAAINLLVPIQIPWMIVPVSLTILTVQLLGSYRQIANVFKWLILALFSYIAAAFFAHPDPGEVLRGTFLPTISLDKGFLSTLVALLGTSITPYMFFWQASQEVEEEIDQGKTSVEQRQGTTRTELRYRALDVNIGMLLSSLVMYFITLTTGATLFKAGQSDIASAADVARALEPLAGSASAALLAVGMIGTGFLAVPVLTGSAAYAISEVFGWDMGLDRKFGQARQFYAVIAIATVVGMTINFVGINPISALFFSAVINGLVAPLLLVLIMLIANHPDIMGRHTNGRWLNVIGWSSVLTMVTAAIGLATTLGGG